MRDAGKERFAEAWHDFKSSAPVTNCSQTTSTSYDGNKPLRADIPLKCLKQILSFMTLRLSLRPTGPSCRSMASRQCWRVSISYIPLWRVPLLSRSNARATITTRVVPSFAFKHHMQSRLEFALPSARDIR